MVALRALRRLSGIISSFAVTESHFIKLATIAVLICQTVLTLSAAYNRTMLFADGAYFNFVIAAGNPWGMHWNYFVSRLTVYLATVLPTAFIYEAFGLSGSDLAKLYSFEFDFVVLIQYVILAIIAWKRFPGLLLFPVIAFSFAVGLGYGFPSEMIIASSFFWICMFSLTFAKVPFMLLSISFVALVFSHELSIFGAILILLYTYTRSRNLEWSNTNRRVATAFYLVGFLAIAVWIYLKFTGHSPGGASNVIYILDPRRIFNNPTLWVLALVSLACYIYARYVKPSCTSLDVLAAAIISGLLTLICGNWFDFLQGRYDSARTLMALSMIGLGSLFVAGHAFRMSMSPALLQPACRSGLKLGLSAALAVNIAASACFISQWTTVRLQIEAITNQKGLSPEDRFISVDTLQIDNPTAAAMLKKVGYAWTLPFLSIMLAPGFEPARIIVDYADMYYTCHSERLSSGKTSQIPASTIEGLKRYACSQEPPIAARSLLSRLRGRFQ